MNETLSTAPAPSWGLRWKLRISAVLWFLLGVAFLLCVPSLWALSPWIVLAALVVALVLALPIAWLVRLVFSGQRAARFRATYIKSAIATFLVLTVALAAPLYYLALRTELNPLTVPQVTLTNGDKTVVFQGMMHVGSEGFYKGVVYDLEQALADGYVIFYEGVQGSPDGDEWFAKTLAGGGDLSDNYRKLADVCGLHFQMDYFRLLQADMAARPERHVAADVTTAQMMHEYERLLQSDPDFAQQVAGKAEPAPEDASAGPDPLGLILGWFQTGTPQQRAIGGIACRGLMTMLLSRTSAPDPMNKVILDFRNRELAQRIASDTNKQIYITYGAGHFPGLLADLEEKDPNWEIASVKWQRAIEDPQELTGKLD